MPVVQLRNRTILYCLIILLCAGILAGCGGTSRKDITPPAVVSKTPVDGATTVQLSSAISVTFSEGVNFDSFTVTNDRNVPIIGTISGNGTNVAAFTPAINLNFNTKYSARVVNVRDGAGNRLGDVAWTFTTNQAVMNYHITPDSHAYDVGQFNSIAMSPVDGKAYIAYYNTSLHQLYLIGTVDGYTFDGPFRVSGSASSDWAGKFCSLAIDATGNFHISYYHEGIGLRYATAANPAGPWTLTTVDNGLGKAVVGTDTAIALDKNGKVHISYYDTTNTALKYATNTSGAWVSETVDTGLPGDNPGTHTSIKLDDNGVVHIVYYDFHADINNGNLKYVFGAAGAWSDRRTLDSTGDVGEFASLAIYKGKIFVAYNHVYPDGHRFVRIITNASGSAWMHRDIVEVSLVANDPQSRTSNPIVIDPTGLVHLAYYKAGTVYYATGILYDAVQNIWDWATAKVVDDSQVHQGIRASITVDSKNAARVSYYDATDGGLKYAQ